jgi:hypothetical protein
MELDSASILERLHVFLSAGSGEPVAFKKSSNVNVPDQEDRNC